MPDMKAINEKDLADSVKRIKQVCDAYDLEFHGAMPYAKNDFEYIEHYLRCQRQYIEHVQQCLSNGAQPIAWELFASIYIIDQE